MTTQRGIVTTATSTPHRPGSKIEADDIVWKREVGERLQLVARAAGVREDQDMCALIGVPRTNWSNWKRGHVMLPVRIAWQLKRTFGCSLEWLYLGEDRMSNTALFNAKLDRLTKKWGG